jgi:MoxR-like ATPase
MSNPASSLERQLRTQLETVVFGMDQVIHGLCIGLIAGGHVLLQGVPGIGKTLLAKSVAAALGGSFNRVQCTADLMPSDITGIHIFSREEKKFEFVPGPLFASIVLVDEINRSGPKTQSALLQAMEEFQVTIDRKTYSLPQDFLVIATQNPRDFEGTFPLPESQLDRFLMRLDVDYPAAAMEHKVLRTYDLRGGHFNATAPITPLAGDALALARAQVAKVHVSEVIYGYVTDIAAASRNHPQINLGLSTRGALALMRCARIESALRDAEFVAPDDVKAMARFVLPHRLMLTPDAALEGVGDLQVAQSILDSVKVPRE